MNYILSNDALSDIEKIVEYSKIYFTPESTLALIKNFSGAFEKLTDNPNIGSEKPHITDKNIRFFLVEKKYWIVYQIKDDNIHIGRVLSSRQNIEEII
jgi:plasmid stabilization system protein ParE